VKFGKEISTPWLPHNFKKTKKEKEYRLTHEPFCKMLAHAARIRINVERDLQVASAQKARSDKPEVMNGKVTSQSVIFAQETILNLLGWDLRFEMCEWSLRGPAKRT